MGNECQVEDYRVCFKLWSAMWTYVHTHDPFVPLGMLKLFVNFDYNKGKWGLDMCTENYHKI